MPRHAIHLKRAYEPVAEADATRLLVDRLWPRGITKENLHIAAWLRDVAPSLALCKWFGHQPALWEGFRERYFAELDANADAVAALRRYLDQGPVTLLYGARDQAHNNALALRDWLQANSHRG